MSVNILPRQFQRLEVVIVPSVYQLCSEGFDDMWLDSLIKEWLNYKNHMGSLPYRQMVG